MSDAGLSWFDFGGDITFEAGDVRHEYGLATSVLISLFTDARAPDVTVLPLGETSLRGWWGDTGTQHITGSLLWLVQREKMLPEVAEKAREYCVDALQWLLDEDIVESVEVEAELIKPSILGIKVTLTRGNAIRYEILWKNSEEYDNVRVMDSVVSLKFKD